MRAPNSDSDIFPDTGKDRTINGSRETRKLPEVVLKDGKRPFNPNTASVLDPAMFDESLPAAGKWLSTSDPDLRLNCRTSKSGTFLVFLIDIRAVHAVGYRLD